MWALPHIRAALACLALPSAFPLPPSARQRLCSAGTYYNGQGVTVTSPHSHPVPRFCVYGSLPMVDHLVVVIYTIGPMAGDGSAGGHPLGVTARCRHARAMPCVEWRTQDLFRNA